MQLPDDRNNTTEMRAYTNVQQTDPYAWAATTPWDYGGTRTRANEGRESGNRRNAVYVQNPPHARPHSRPKRHRFERSLRAPGAAAHIRAHTRAARGVGTGVTCLRLLPPSPIRASASPSAAGGAPASQLRGPQGRHGGRPIRRSTVRARESAHTPSPPLWVCGRAWEVGTRGVVARGERWRTARPRNAHSKRPDVRTSFAGGPGVRQGAVAYVGAWARCVMHRGRRMVRPVGTEY